MEGDDEFEAHPERLRQLREVRTIGRGSTGDAILVESLETRRLYCVKQIALAAPPPASEFGSEVDVLRRLEHENVTRFYGAYLDERDGGTRLRIVMEYADSGTLAQWLSLRWDCAREDERWGLIAEEEIMGCFAQVVAGLAHVHAQRVLHRDLKAENILVSRASERDETFKLSDFGISRILTETQAMATTCIGSARADPADAAPRARSALPLCRALTGGRPLHACSPPSGPAPAHRSPLLPEPRDGGGAALLVQVGCLGTRRAALQDGHGQAPLPGCVAAPPAIDPRRPSASPAAANRLPIRRARNCRASPAQAQTWRSSPTTSAAPSTRRCRRATPPTSTTSSRSCYRSSPSTGRLRAS
jgi:serine/threonine protein kinase